MCVCRLHRHSVQVSDGPNGPHRHQIVVGICSLNVLAGLAGLPCKLSQMIVAQMLDSENLTTYKKSF